MLSKFKFPKLPSFHFSSSNVNTAITIAAIGVGCAVTYAVFQKYHRSADQKLDIFPAGRIPTVPLEESEPSVPFIMESHSETDSESRVAQVPIHVSRMYIYPIKACAGMIVSEARVTNRGLANDRIFMLVDNAHSGRLRSINLRKAPRLALVNPIINKSGDLVISAPGMVTFYHTVRKKGPRKPVSHYDTICGETVDQGNDIADWFQTFLSMNHVRLVRLPDDYVRKVENRHVEPGLFQNSFSDKYPFLLAAEASLKDLSDKVNMKLEMARFRPNIVISSHNSSPLPAYAEDGWKKVSIGDETLFEIPTSCNLSIITNVDPETGEFDKENQLMDTLRKHRIRGNKVLFGRYMVPIQTKHETAIIQVGNPVTIVESTEPGQNY